MGNFCFRAEMIQKLHELEIHLTNLGWKATRIDVSDDKNLITRFPPLDGSYREFIFTCNNLNMWKNLPELEIELLIPGDSKNLFDTFVTVRDREDNLELMSFTAPIKQLTTAVEKVNQLMESFNDFSVAKLPQIDFYNHITIKSGEVVNNDV